jgi:2-dehydro-3-deoxyphosphogluconate aldolase/(4S)-4-hydroxy-2-oxoglutarate aldolase
VTQTDIRSFLKLSPVIPVVTIHRADDAVPLARALVAGGLNVIEVTLRTAAGLDAIRAIAADVPELAVGAGTVLNPQDLRAAIDAGSRFTVSPGLTPALLREAVASGVPYLPGAATAAELMIGLEAGIDCFKFFPAAPIGASVLKSFAGPFATVSFCATGGITMDNAPDFLALPNVLCVGATWVVPDAALTSGDWTTVEANARRAAGLA